MGTVRGHGGRERSGVMTGGKEGTVGGKGKGMVRDHGEIKERNGNSHGEIGERKGKGHEEIKEREQSQGDKGKERGGKGMVRGHGVSGTLSIPIGD